MFRWLTAGGVSSRLRAVEILRPSACAVACLALATTGCVAKEFQDTKAQSIMASAPIHLDAEQVSLTSQQVECGVQNDLWAPPSTASGAALGIGEVTRLTARLEGPGRDLHFDDDVIVSEPGFRQPYVQVRGDFMMNLADANIHDDGPDGRIVDGKLGVIIHHNCFPDPLPVLGVRKGHFSQDVNPVMEFGLHEDGWHFEKLVH